MIDTVKLRSPVIDEGTAVFLERQCILKQGIELSSGEVLYEITTGDLQGSYDSRISFKVCRKDWVMDGGRLQELPCPPFVLVECSLHKFFHGQNVYGNPTDFQRLCHYFVNMLGEIMGCDHDMFSAAAKWQVRRVDWAEMYNLPPEAQAEFFRSLKNAKFPRRALKEAKYASAVHFPGKFTTFRIYSKGPEFKLHDYPRVLRALVKMEQQKDGQERSRAEGNVNLKVVAGTKKYKWCYRRINALQRLANHRLRAEVQINADKLHYDFKGRYPLVSEITDEYLIDIYQTQVFRLMKEGKTDMETVRTYDRVKARLNALYGTRSANTLLAFWMALSARGEDVVKPDYSHSQYYANRKKLIDAGISWNSTDVFIVPQDTALPRDFIPLPSDPRRCVGGVSPRSVFAFCPVEQYRARIAA